MSHPPLIWSPPFKWKCNTCKEIRQQTEQCACKESCPSDATLEWTGKDWLLVKPSHEGWKEHVNNQLKGSYRFIHEVQMTAGELKTRLDKLEALVTQNDKDLLHFAGALNTEKVISNRQERDLLDLKAGMKVLGDYVQQQQRQISVLQAQMMGQRLRPLAISPPLEEEKSKTQKSV